MADDLIGRLTRRTDDPPCQGPDVLDHCGGHHDGFCFHEEPRSQTISKRYVEYCLTCRRRPEILAPAPADVRDFTDGEVQPARPSWDDYFFEIARLVSTRATCPRAQIGVVLVDAKKRLVGTGYNGAPAGEPHCTDAGVGCRLYAGHCIRSRHAERNAVNAAWESMGNPGFEQFLYRLDITPYVYGPRPICSECAATMARAGIRREPLRREP